MVETRSPTHTKNAKRSGLSTGALDNSQR